MIYLRCGHQGAAQLVRYYRATQNIVHALESRIAGESEYMQEANICTVEEFANLAEDLEELWTNPNADERTKKRLLRALIREIVVDLDEQTSEVVLLIHWKGGQHT